MAGFMGKRKTGCYHYKKGHDLTDCLSITESSDIIFLKWGGNI